MKKNLIKRVLFLLLLPFQLFATTYEWKTVSNKDRAYLNEAIYLSYVCEFSDRAELYAVEFDPLKSDENATIVMLSETSRIEDGKKRLVYEFVAFAHRTGKIEFDFEALMKKTTRDSIENTVIGRDNAKFAEYQTKKVRLQKLQVEVMDTKTPLVGELKVEVKKDKPEVKSLTPYHLEVRISGMANFSLLKPLDFKIDGVKVFSEKPLQKIELTKEGYKGVWSQKFAFVSEKPFLIEPFSITYFDLMSKEKKELSFEGISVNVVEGYKKKDLLDKEPQSKIVFSWEYLYYLLAFVAGFLVAKIEFKKTTQTVDDNFCTKVKNCTSLSTLSVLLALEDEEKYRDTIVDIENGELTNLQKSKKLICG